MLRIRRLYTFLIDCLFIRKSNFISTNSYDVYQFDNHARNNFPGFMQKFDHSENNFRVFKVGRDAFEYSIHYIAVSQSYSDVQSNQVEKDKRQAVMKVNR